jgi:hypothetical protein
MFKRIVVLSILLLVIAMSSQAFAQDGTPIKYGDTTSGEITNDTFEVSYLFSGTQGDVVVVEMRRANSDSGLYNAALLLLAPDGSLLADSTDYFAYEGADALIAAELPEDGKYTLLATRDNGRTGDEEGEYTLKLLQPVELSETPTQGNVNNDIQDQYYVVRPGGSFNIDYRFLDGNYAPLVDVYFINETGYPESVATLSGVRMDHGTVEVFADEGELFVVAIVVDDLDYMFTDDIDASYEVSSAPA